MKYLKYLWVLLFIFATANAQETNVFPLVSLGNAQNWQAGQDDYRIVVPKTSNNPRVRIEVRSPNMNLADPIARGDLNWFVGDEQYDKKLWRTDFLIQTPSQKTLVSRTYAADSRNRWERFLHQPLPVGIYPLSVKSIGNGKNAFVVALQYASLQSSQFTANAFGGIGLERTVAELKVSPAMLGKGLELGNYDADGQELEFFVQLPNGQRQGLKSSAARAWALNEIMVTKALLGTWTVRVRVSANRQNSNTFTMRFREVTRAGVKPFYANLFVVLPTTPPALTTPRLIQGTPSIALPPTKPQVPTVKPPITNPPINPPINPVNPPITNPPVNPPITNPPTNPNASADLELIQSAEPNPVEPTQPFVLTATIRNDGPENASNVIYNIALPSGLETTSQSSSQGDCVLVNRVLTCQLGDLERSASAIVLVALRSSNASTYDLLGTTTSLTTDPNISNNTDRLTVAVQRAVTPANLRLSRLSLIPSPALPGEMVEVRLLLENLGEQPTDFNLQDNPSQLLRAQQTPAQTGRLEARERREMIYRADVVAGLPSSAKLLATVSAPDLETQSAETIFTRVNAELNLRLASSLIPRPNTSIPLEAVITNPLNRSVTLDLSLNAPDLNLETTKIQVRLTARQTRVIPITARADSAGTYLVGANLSLNNVAVAPDASLEVEARDIPNRTRRSQIGLRFDIKDVPDNAEIIIVDQIPDGAAFEADSSLLDTKPLGNPLEAEDYVFWDLGLIRGQHQILYTLLHSQALNLPENRIGILLRLPAQNNRPAEYRVLQGTPAILGLYLGQLESNRTPLPPSRERIGALIVNPANGTIIRNRDRINVLIDLPLKAEQISLRVNGELISQDQAGSTTYDEGTERLTIEYVAVRLQPGRNQLQLRAFDPKTNAFIEDSSLIQLAGEAVRLKIEAVGNLTADPQDRPSLRLSVLDNNGLLVSDGVVDWQSDPLPAIPDAAPNIAGYQVQYTNGTALIPLSSIGERSVVTAEARLGKLIVKIELPVVSSQRPWVVIGNANLSAEITDPFSLGAGLQGFARGSLGNGFLLTIGINLSAQFSPVFEINGNLEPIANPFERFPLLGDAAQRGQDVNSSDPFYIRLERGASYAMYGSYQAGLIGRLSAYNSRQQGIQLLWRDPILNFTAFGSYQPRASLSNLSASQPFGFRGDGTSLYQLGQALQTGSERIRIFTRDKDNLGLIITTRELQRLVDYSLDPQSGIVFLTKPLTSTDENNNPQFLVIEYAPATGTAPLEYRFGTQAQINLKEWRITGTAVVFNPSKNPLYALGLSYNNDNLRLESELAYSSDWALSLSGRYKTPIIEAIIEYQALGIGYEAINPSQAAASFRASAIITPNDALRLQTSFSSAHSFTALTTRSEINASATQRIGIFSASLGLNWRFLSSLGNQSNLGYLTTGLAVNIGRSKIALETRTPLSNAPFQIVGSLEYALTDNLKLELRDTYSFDGSNEGAILLRGTFGTTNVSAAYDLPSLSGDSGRARLGIDTTIPLTRDLSASISAEITAPIGADATASLSTSLRREAEDYNATVLAQYAFLTTGIKQVYRVAVNIQPQNSQLVFSPSLEMTTSPSGNGLRFSAAGAYRSATLSILTQHQIRYGIYAPNNNELTGEIQNSYNPNPNFGIRGGIGYKYASNILTTQINLATRYWLRENLGIGAQAIWQWQPNISSRIALGLESTLHIGNGIGITGGFNFIGFDSSLGNFSVKPGFYIRLEFLFNEQTFGLR
jgi:uncharacterized repeat protein (TIGR01451 family)